MRRLATMILALAPLAGCHSATPVVNPFTAPATIPPPGTTAPMMGQNPYYSGQPQPVTPPVGTAPASPPAVPYQPPAGNYQYQGSNRYQQPAGAAVAVLDRNMRGAQPAAGSWRPSADGQQSYAVARAETDAVIDSYRGTINRALVETMEGESPRADLASAELPVARGPVIEHGRSVIRVLEPEVSQARATGSAAISAAQPASYEEAAYEEGAPSTEASAEETFNWGSLDGHLEQRDSADAVIRVASYEAQDTAPVSRTSAPVTRRPAGLYEYDPQYRWLQGELEYSNIDQHWKLRYIPPDGETDSFGGSVVIENPEAWGEFAEGDFVIAQGAVVQDHPNRQQFSPVYELDELQRQANP